MTGCTSLELGDWRPGGNTGFRGRIMRKVLLKRALLLAVTAMWVFAALTSEASATKWPAEPKTRIPSDVKKAVQEARELADAFDSHDYSRTCAWLRKHRAVARSEEVLAKLRRQSKAAADAAATYSGADQSGLRDYLHDVTDYLEESQVGFLWDEFFFRCPWSYYVEYGKTPVPINVSEFPESNFELSVSGELGQLHLPVFKSALQLERLSAVVDPQFGHVDRNDNYQAFKVDASIPFRVSGFTDRVIFGYRYGTASNNSFWGSMPTGGADLNILSPQGPNGSLNGGVNVNGAGGFADVTSLNYTSDYSEQLGYLGLSYKPWRFGNTEFSIKPYTKVFVGYDRESSNYSGTTANGGLDFAYINHIHTSRWGGEIGAHADQPIGRGFGLYADGAVRFVYNYGSADSTLGFAGAVNATESATANVNKYDTGFVAGGGVYARSGNAEFSAGAAYETWEVPTLLYSQTAPFTLDYQSRNSFGVSVGFKYRFGPARALALTGSYR
jgi:hypothetical protein